MPVRCEALSVLARRLPGDAPPTLLLALLDTHSSLRAAARYFIRQSDPVFNFANIYRHGLQDDSIKTQDASLMGLGETGLATHPPLVLPYLKSSSVAVRKAAIRALAALDGSRYATQFFELITDDHPGISKEATKALIAKCRPVDADLGVATVPDGHPPTCPERFTINHHLGIGLDEGPLHHPCAWGS